MKLHLGCGQRYLEGYINIDFPSEEHTFQKKSVADRHVNILELSYPSESIEEIRLHHVFEHFMRPTACALLSGWYFWLKPKGILRIEVPDLYKTALVLYNPFRSYNKKMVAIRHIFGSHEASWAVHCEGYTIFSMKKLLTLFGYRVITVGKNNWRGTYNFEIIAEKSHLGFTENNFKVTAQEYLKSFLIHENDEMDMLALWMLNFEEQFYKIFENKA